MPREDGVERELLVSWHNHKWTLSIRLDGLRARADCPYDCPG